MRLPTDVPGAVLALLIIGVVGFVVALIAASSLAEGEQHGKRRRLRSEMIARKMVLTEHGVGMTFVGYQAIHRIVERLRHAEEMAEGEEWKVQR